jgi:exopolysaccharide biosynthesis polyprenyl glycosylphosphotransferase
LEDSVSPVERKSRRWRLQTGERRLLLILGDLLAASAASFGALWLWAEQDYLGFTTDFVRARAAWFVLLPLIWLLLMINLYDVRRAGSWRETLRGALMAAAGGIVLYLIVYFSSEPGSLPRRGVLYFLVLTAVLTLTWRWIYVRVFTAPAFMRRVLIVGAGESGQSLLDVINDMWPPPYFVVGFVDDDASKQGQEISGIHVLGDNSRLLELIEEEAVSDIVVAILGSMNGEMFQALLDAQERGVQITRMPVAYEELLSRVPIRHLESDWLLRSFVDEIRISPLYLMAKRVIDILGALIGLFVFILIYPWVALAILLESRRPILFTQSRLGQGGRTYDVVKFRTMHQDAEADGQAHWARVNDPRATRVGNFLRKTHLDEIPQFWNVLRGDMSIVGPRPERPELVVELEEQIPFYRARLLTKPGITGWAQVNYGKGASVEGSAEKLEYDLYYIKHRSVVLDLQIILRTIRSVIGFRGV